MTLKIYQNSIQGFNIAGLPKHLKEALVIDLLKNLKEKYENKSIKIISDDINFLDEIHLFEKLTSSYLFKASEAHDKLNENDFKRHDIIIFYDITLTNAEMQLLNLKDKTFIIFDRYKDVFNYFLNYDVFINIQDCSKNIVKINEVKNRFHELDKYYIDCRDDKVVNIDSNTTKLIDKIIKRDSEKRLSDLVKDDYQDLLDIFEDVVEYNPKTKFELGSYVFPKKNLIHKEARDFYNSHKIQGMFIDEIHKISDNVYYLISNEKGFEDTKFKAEELFTEYEAYEFIQEILKQHREALKNEIERVNNTLKEFGEKE